MSQKAKQFRNLLQSSDLEFILEAHNGISAKIVEETGFKGIWASGLSLSASLGVRDNNEASWTQILEVLEYMSDATNIPILLDGDTGYGNYNNARRLVKKLEQRDVAAVCIEDKVFPKTNSFINGEKQPLADVEEFSGKIKAMKDTQKDSNFSVIARLESFITGWGLDSALQRASKYYEAGADGILVHSKIDNFKEIESFANVWDKKCPLIIVPTTYYKTPTDEFRNNSISMIIWANHMIRSSITAMQATAKNILDNESLVNVNNDIASVKEIFRLQNINEMKEADNNYLPANEEVSAIILAASKGPEFEHLTEYKPKTMIEINGKSILSIIKSTLLDSGIKDITVVGGFNSEIISLENINLVKNQEWNTTGNTYSLKVAERFLEGPCIVSYGDLIYEKSLIEQLLDSTGDIVLLADSSGILKSRDFNYWLKGSIPPSDEYGSPYLCNLEEISLGMDESSNSQWVGLLKLSSKGSEIFKNNFDKFFESVSKQAMLGDYIKFLQSKGYEINIRYTRGRWFDIDNKKDLDLLVTKNSN